MLQDTTANCICLSKLIAFYEFMKQHSNNNHTIYARVAVLLKS